MYPTNLPFIESIRIVNKNPLLLKYHQKRVEDTFYHFNKSENTLHLQNIIQSINIPTNTTYKLRILYDLNGAFEFELLPYSMGNITDFECMEAPDLDYSFKYQNREAINHLKEKSNANEIIITQNGQITDSSFSNLIFLKDNQWFTPKTYLLNGVQRQFLLEQKQIEETDIHLGNLSLFSHFALINAMRDLENSPIYPISLLLKE